MNEKAQIVTDFLVSVVISTILLSFIFTVILALYNIPENLIQKSEEKLSSESVSTINKLSYSNYVFTLGSNSDNCIDFITHSQGVNLHYGC